MAQEGIQQLIDIATRYQLSIVLFVGTVLLGYLVRLLLTHRLEQTSKKTTSHWDDLAVDLVRQVRWPTVICLAYIAASAAATDWSFTMPTWLRVVLIAVLTYQAVKFSHAIFRYSKNHLGTAGGAMLIDGFRTILSIIIYAVGGLVILTTLNYNVTSIVAGLGIGGIAVAFALQNILSDIFSSLSIYFDQPFKVGDFISTGKEMGTVRRIGLKTTRLKSLSGEMIIVANKDLTNASLRNYRGIKSRRIEERLTIAMSTPNKKLEQLQVELPAELNSIPGVTFKRIHLDSFGQFGLDHELIYEIDTESYDEYTATKNIVNLVLKKYFEQKKIALAYPTQTLFVKKS